MWYAVWYGPDGLTLVYPSSTQITIQVNWMSKYPLDSNGLPGEWMRGGV